MKTPLTRKMLNNMGCGTPNCGHDHTVLHLHSVCHISAGTDVKYNKQTETITVSCLECKKYIVEIAVK